MLKRGDMSRHLQLGDILAQRLCLLLKDNSHVLDIGGGDGRHSILFAEKGHQVIFNDFEEPPLDRNNITPVICDFMVTSFTIPRFDAVFISHVLEHQLNVNSFLKKASKAVHDGGLIAIAVPPAKSQIVSGHITLWNAGLVLYNLVLAGLDCSRAMILQHRYNISVIIRKEEIKLPKLNFDYGDLTELKKFFPVQLDWSGDGFNGEIQELNWNL